MKRAVSKKECSKCGELFHPGILWRHEKYCEGIKKKKKKKIKSEWKQENGMYKCPYCDKEFSPYGIVTHIYKKHTEEGRKQNPNIGYELGTQKIWNKNIPMREESKKKLSKSLSGKKKPLVSKETRKKQSESRIKSIKEGRTPRWQTISGNSYPEKYFEKYLINEGLSFKTQYHIFNGKRNYFLDFYFTDKKVNLEIDGLQHNWPERIESDKRRDKYLNSQNIKVIRIQWKNPSCPGSKEYFREKIEELKGLLND
jgi:very-short-patch-repair endonuclease